jgi:hypothetical protein
MEGDPVDAIPPVLSPTDAIVERHETAHLPVCPSSDQIEIEIVALSLVSVSPITVTYGGGDPELWEAKMCLSSLVPQTPGTMIINRDCDDGGTFSAELPVIPKIIFTRIDPPYSQSILDFGAFPYAEILFTETGHWTYSDPGFNAITSPGGVMVDHDCDGVFNVGVGPSTNFYWGIYPVPCNCLAPPSDYQMLMTYWNAACAAHGCLPPVSGGYAYLPGDANMFNGAWPPMAIGGDVTFLVNYLRGMSASPPCLLDGFWASADVNGDCRIIGSDVTKLVTYFRGTGSILYCPDYPPLYPPLPPSPPPGWPNCD